MSDHGLGVNYRTVEVVLLSGQEMEIARLRAETAELTQALIDIRGAAATALLKSEHS